MANAQRDNNSVATLIGLSNADASTPILVLANPTTQRLMVEYEGSNFIANSYSESNYDNSQAIGSGITGAAQSFAGKAGVLERSTFYLFKVFGATGNIVSKLYNMSGTLGVSGIPNGTALATSDNVDITTIALTPSLINFTFSGSNKTTLSASTNYCISVEYSSSGNNLEVGIDASDPKHQGNYSDLSGGLWGATSLYDVCFYVYVSPATSNTSSTKTEATKDANNIDALLGTSNSDGTTPTTIYANSSLGRLFVKMN